MTIFPLKLVFIKSWYSIWDTTLHFILSIRNNNHLYLLGYSMILSPSRGDLSELPTMQSWDEYTAVPSTCFLNKNYEYPFRWFNMCRNGAIHTRHVTNNIPSRSDSLIKILNKILSKNNGERDSIKQFIKLHIISRERTHTNLLVIFNYGFKSFIDFK